MASVARAAPPPLVRMAADSLRWRLLRELSGSDRRVRELVMLTGQRQSLVSYHLARLRASGLVGARRSSFDGRDTYYYLDLSQCARELAAVGTALHPGLRLDPALPVPAGGHRPVRCSVLFLCTGNSAGSQIAEALARTPVRSHDRVKSKSAGSHPKPLHPNAVRVMAEHGIDISGHSRQCISAASPQNPVRLRDHAVRSGAGGLSRVSRPAQRQRTLEHPRPRRRG